MTTIEAPARRVALDSEYIVEEVGDYIKLFRSGLLIAQFHRDLWPGLFRFLRDRVQPFEEVL